MVSGRWVLYRGAMVALWRNGTGQWGLSAIVFSAALLGCGPAQPAQPVTVPIGTATAAPTTTAAPDESAALAHFDGASTLTRLLAIGLSTIGKEGPAKLPLEFAKTTVPEGQEMLEAALPNADHKKGKGSGNTHIYVQADLDSWFMVLRFGNQRDAYQNKLYCAQFTIYKKRGMTPPRASKVFRAIVTARGEPSAVDKFHFSDDSVADDLDMYVWDDPNTVINYRSFHDTDEDQDVTVVNFCDAKFYHTHKYWNY